MTARFARLRQCCRTTAYSGTSAPTLREVLELVPNAQKTLPVATQAHAAIRAEDGRHDTAITAGIIESENSAIDNEMQKAPDS